MIYTITLNPSIDYIVYVNGLKIGDLNRTASDLKFPGGKGINVSRILKRLGHDTTTLGFLGGFTGGFIHDCLKKEGVCDSFTNIHEDTRINIKLKSDSETEINGLGPVISEKDKENLKDSLKKITQNDIVILAGSIPPSLPKDFYNNLIEIILSKGAKFAIDTTGESLLKAISRKPILIKPNKHELEEIFNVKFKNISEIIPYGERLLKDGAEYVLVSMAGDGALLFTHKGNFTSNVPKGVVKNSVGAGDSMVAGFIGTYAKTGNIVESFRYGVASGSATAFSDDLASKEEILQLLEKIKIINI